VNKKPALEGHEAAVFGNFGCLVIFMLGVLLFAIFAPKRW
jgi:hypothetical protein